MAIQNTLSGRQALETKYNNSRNNLLLVVVFTVINIIFLITKSNLFFLFSAYIPYALADIGMLICGIYPAEYCGENFPRADTISPSFFAVFLAVALIMLILYLISWIFSKNNKVGWLIFGLVFFLIDTVLMLALTGIQQDSIINIAFHVWVIVSLAMGINANSKLRKLPPDEVNTPETEEAAETQGDLQNP